MTPSRVQRLHWPAMSFRDEEELYQDHVLDHYESPYQRGHCDSATHMHADDNPLCGDVVHVELEIDRDGRIAQAWFDGDGCCISQASASMLMEAIEGRTVEDVKRFSADEMLNLFGARLTPNRQKCCLLSWQVLQAAIFSPVREDRSDGDGWPALNEQSEDESR